jgi:Tfp pilus assembly protein PilO
VRIDVTQKRTMVGVAVIAALFGGLLWYPAQRDMTRISQQIALAQQELMGTQGKTVSLKELAVEVQRMDAELKSSKRVIPREGELADLLRDLNQQIAEARLGEQSVVTKPQIEGQGYLTMPVEVNFRGDSRSAFALMNRVESMPKLVQVTGLRMQTERGSNRIEAQLELNSFFYANREQTP